MLIPRVLRMLALAAGLFLLFHAAVWAVAEPGDRFYTFLYERSFIQPTTIFTACLIVVMLLERCKSYFRERDLWKTVAQHTSCPPPDVAQLLTVVSTTRQKHGHGAALAHVQQIAEQRRERVRKSYASIGYLGGCLPALGLFGTMLGMSNALYSAFSGGSLGPASIQTFVASLANAMDTTVLAMICAAPLFTAVWLLERVDTDLGDSEADYIRRSLGLDVLAHTDKTVDALRTELRSLATAIAREAHSSFAAALRDSTTAYQESLTQMVRDIVSQERAHHETMIRQVAEHTAGQLAAAVQSMSDRMEAHNNQTAEEVVRQVAQLERALRNRTPEEVIIRYQRDPAEQGGANGHAHGNGNGRGHVKELIHA